MQWQSARHLPTRYRTKERIEAVNPYNGDFQATIDRSRVEMESGELPEVQWLPRKPCSIVSV
jgi:hypothetical protein